jgi:hypothetical protein
MRNVKRLGIASSMVSVAASILSFVVAWIKGRPGYVFGGLIWLAIAYVNIRITRGLASGEPRKRVESTS